eukprot:3275170-Amphidinium_carterae.1
MCGDMHNERCTSETRTLSSVVLCALSLSLFPGLLFCPLVAAPARGAGTALSPGSWPQIPLPPDALKILHDNQPVKTNTSPCPQQCV